jgi:6-phosphogluconolactonase
MDPAILISDTAQDAAEACGKRTFEILEDARRQRGVARLAVSGGNTPRTMFRWMAEQSFHWDGVEIFQVDERCVPPDHELSNYRMIREALLDAVPIEAGRFHRIWGELAPEEAARIYVDEMRTSFGLKAGDLPAFDVIQRGMGPDGHTASLFPGEPLIEDAAGLAAAVWVEKMRQHRVTLLPGVLRNARHTLCLVTGPDKADALRAVLKGPSDPLEFPARIASPSTEWIIDRSAGAKLFDPPGKDGSA